jgi:hypothetical protein
MRSPVPATADACPAASVGPTPPCLDDAGVRGEEASRSRSAPGPAAIRSDPGPGAPGPPENLTAPCRRWIRLEHGRGLPATERRPSGYRLRSRSRGDSCYMSVTGGGPGVLPPRAPENFHRSSSFGWSHATSPVDGAQAASSHPYHQPGKESRDFYLPGICVFPPALIRRSPVPAVREGVPPANMGSSGTTPVRRRSRTSSMNRVSCPAMPWTRCSIATRLAPTSTSAPAFGAVSLCTRESTTGSRSPRAI